MGISLCLGQFDGYMYMFIIKITRGKACVVISFVLFIEAMWNCFIVNTFFDTEQGVEMTKLVWQLNDRNIWLIPQDLHLLHIGTFVHATYWQNMAGPFCYTLDYSVAIEFFPWWILKPLWMEVNELHIFVNYNQIKVLKSKSTNVSRLQIGCGT
jgi:hypothetical protein